MAWVRYRALKKSGEETIGRIEANDVKSALAALHRDGMIAYDAQLENDHAEWWNQDLFQSNKISSAAQAIFARELSTLVNANLPLDETLQTIASQATDRTVTNAAQSLLAEIQSGGVFSDALTTQNLFSERHRAIVSAGEAGGALGESLDQVAALIEREAKIRGEVRAALFYPAILLTVSMIAVIFILTVLLPSLAPIFESADAELPVVTAFFMNTGLFMKSNAIAFTIALVIIFAAAAASIRSPNARARLDAFALTIPVFGDILTKTNAARIMRTLGALLDNGVSMTKALSYAVDISDNHILRSATSALLEDVQHGKSFSAAFSAQSAFPELAHRLVNAGDRSGALAEMLIKGAEIFETQTKRDIDRAVALITPILTLSIGLLVGGIVVSVLTAILSVNDLAY